MFAVNDARGNLTGRMDALDVGHAADEVIRLTGDAAYREYRDGVRIGGMVFPVRPPVGHYVGNLCWNGARMELAVLAGLLNHLRRRRWYCEVAEAGLFEVWESGEEVTEAALARALAAGAGGDGASECSL